MITMCMDKNCVDDAASLFWAVYLLWAHVLNRNIHICLSLRKKGLFLTVMNEKSVDLYKKV